MKITLTLWRTPVRDLTAAPWRVWITTNEPAAPGLLDRVRFWILGMLP